MPSRRWRAFRYRLRLRIKAFRQFCHRWWVRFMWLGLGIVGLSIIVTATSIVAPGVVGFSSEESLTASDTPPAGDELNETQLEKLIVAELNAERTRRKHRRLRTRPDLSAVAGSYAETMAKYGDSGHRLGGAGPEERYLRAGVTCQFSGETAAKTWYRTEIDTLGGTRYYANASELAQGLVTQWLNSPPHREILLSRDHVAVGSGISIVWEDEGWAVYAVMDFCR